MTSLGGGWRAGHGAILPAVPDSAVVVDEHASGPWRWARSAAPSADRPLDVLKALGDNTRYAIYLELARSPLPLARPSRRALDLHANTVRPHLERMRDVGLLDVETEHRGGVGRPSTATRLAPAPRRSASSRPPSRCSPACSLQLAARGRARPPTTPPRSGASRAASTASAQRPPRPRLRARRARPLSSPARLRPRAGRATTTAPRVAFTHCPFRRARRGPPRAGLPPAPRAWSRASSTRSADARGRRRSATLRRPRRRARSDLRTRWTE